MKNLRVLLVLISLCSAGSLVRAQAGDAQAQYSAAVKAYVDAATDELRAIRGSVDGQVAAISNEADKKRFNEVLGKLSACDRLLVDLKKAGPRDFDLTKAKYEKARAEATKALDQANKKA